MKKYIHSNADFMCVNFVGISKEENADKKMIVLFQLEWKSTSGTVTEFLPGQISWTFLIYLQHPAQVECV